jgi:ABC-2 type transport system permease protein
MNKILVIARREYQAMVGTKAFIIGIAMMPVLMMGGIWLPGLLRGIEKPKDRHIAVIDGTGQLFEMMQLAAEQRNAMLKNVASDSDTEAVDAGPTTDPNTGIRVTGADADQQRKKKSLGLEDINSYLLEEIPSEGFDDEQRFALSDRVRNEELYAFIEIPGDLLDQTELDLTDPESLKLPSVIYCSQDAALSDARRWVDKLLNSLVRANRMSAMGVSPLALLELERRAPVEAAGLYSRDDSGAIVSEEKPDELTSLFLPMGIMMLMFMIVMMSANPMLESVLEEKAQRISEVLLGSANARQLMTGKLLGNVGGSLTVFALYGLGGVAVANWQGRGDIIPLHIVPWFLVYQILAVLLFSSVFMAIAASVSQLREAQSLLLPVWMVMMLPLMVWLHVVREPNSTLATVLSFFPPSTPLMMTLRLATGATVPVWQIALSIVILLAGTMVGVTAASRIYRIGILWQGNTPKLKDLVMWVVRNPIAASAQRKN